MRLLAISLVLLASHLLVAMAVLNDEQKAEILEAQNYFRSIVDPIATDMAALVSKFVTKHVVARIPKSGGTSA